MLLLRISRVTYEGGTCEDSLHSVPLPAVPLEQRAIFTDSSKPIICQVSIC